MNLDDVMHALATKATPSTKKTYLRHGCPEPVFGVRVGDLKPLQRKLKGRQELALELFATGNSDAMYLAGLIADGAKMTRAQLNAWAEGATWRMIAGTIVPWVAVEHADGFGIASEWIDAPRELTAVAGWSTLSSLVAVVADDALPIRRLAALLDRCGRTIHKSPNLVRHAMNSFVIYVGTYVAPLGDHAIEMARKIGTVEVDMGNTACEVPAAEPYILKSRRGAPVAPKRKTARC